MISNEVFSELVADIYRSTADFSQWSLELLLLADLESAACRQPSNDVRSRLRKNKSKIRIPRKGRVRSDKRRISENGALLTSIERLTASIGSG